MITRASTTPKLCELSSPCGGRGRNLLQELRDLRAEVESGARELVARWEHRIQRTGCRERALNLAHYIVLRRRDLRALQDDLTLFGLSSLGRLEGRVIANLDAVIAALAAITSESEASAFPDRDAMLHGPALTEANADQALGPCAELRPVRLMVTLPMDAAENPEFALSVLEHGADLVRINCAHDDPPAWNAMISNVRAAACSLQRPVRILMDLAGPKCRTQQIKAEKGRKRLHPGDEFLLVRDTFQPMDRWPVQASCSLVSVFDQIRAGALVWVDEGRLGGIVRSVQPEGVIIEVRAAPPGGMKLKPDKGMNFPETDLGVPPLTEKDLVDLDFVARHADLVGYSFVQSAEDVALLQQELAARIGAERAAAMGIVAKIETARAVRNLPEILVQGAGCQPFAVMIARGDLAVEIGFARLAEIQEEILWLCEAAHVPVIWATGVLTGLIKDGQTNRGEMTDAAMSARAECVMLNKGPHILEALQILDELFVRMTGHQHKKTPRLRALKSW